MRRRIESDAESGAALLLVLWVLALLSLLAAASLQLSVDAGHIGEAMRQRARLQAAADGAIALAAQQLLEQEHGSAWKPDGSVRNLSVGDLAVAVTASDAAGMVDVNHAPPELLAQVFKAVGATPSEAARWSATLVPGGDSPIAAGKHKLFHTLDEAAAMAGIPERTLGCLQSLLTVFSGLGGVDPRYAPKALRSVLRITAPQPGQESAAGPVSIAGHVLLLQARVGEGEAVFSRQAVVRLTGDPHDPLMTASWTQTYAPGASSDCSAAASP